MQKREGYKVILIVYNKIMEFSLSAKNSPYCSTVLGRLGAAASEDAAVSDLFAALNKETTPSAAEFTVLPCELDDPLGESRISATGRLFRQYKNRALLKVTGECFSHCRYCIYRTHEETAISTDELKEACAFLAEHAEIIEIIISGGDPLALSDADLARIFEEIRAVRPGMLIRLCTRAPVHAPERITRETLAMFRRFRPFWLVPQINHPAEISARWAPEAQKCLLSIVDAGIPVQSDTLLLKGVNDTPVSLVELFTLLVHLGIKPGYLYQPGLAKGTGHFRVTLSEGLKLYNQLKKELSDLALPDYVVDLPGGGGLVNVPATRFAREGDSWKVTDSSGKNWFYPV